ETDTGSVGFPALIPYPVLFAGLLPGSAAEWYDPATGAAFFPVRTLAGVAGLVLLPPGSRLAAPWGPPRAVRTAAGWERPPAPPPHLARARRVPARPAGFPFDSLLRTFLRCAGMGVRSDSGVASPFIHGRARSMSRTICGLFLGVALSVIAGSANFAPPVAAQD